MAVGVLLHFLNITRYWQSRRSHPRREFEIELKFGQSEIQLAWFPLRFALELREPLRILSKNVDFLSCYAIGSGKTGQEKNPRLLHH